MNWIQRAEQKFGFLGIPGLAAILTGLNLLVYVLCQLNRSYLEFLVFDPDLILKGQVWRLITFLFIPSFGVSFFVIPGWLTCVLYLMWLYYVTSALEHAIGPFRLTLYYFIGCVALIAACFLLGAHSYASSALITTSVFLAFAHFYPESVIYLMFILPVKVKWLAWITVALLLFSFIGADWQGRFAILAGLVNYLLFFGPELVRGAKSRHEVSQRRAKFEREVRAGAEETLHRCAVCQRTELSAPELEFRVSRDGQEYCTEHLPKPPATTP